MVDDAVWKRRFHLFALVRVSGLLIFFLGIGIIFSDLLRPGGWPLVGGIIAAMGLADALIAPRLMKRMWDKQGR